MTARFDSTMLETIYNSGDLPLLGHVAFWRVEDAEMPHTDLVAIMDKHGFKSQAPAEATPRAAMRDALKEWTERRGRSRLRNTGQGKRSKTVIDAANTDGNELHFFLDDREFDLGLVRLDHATRLRVTVHKDTGHYEVSTESQGVVGTVLTQDAQIRAQIAPLYQHHRETATSQVINGAILRVVESLNSVSLRPTGGVYFVPITQREAVERLRLMCDEIAAAKKGSEVFLLASPVVKVEETRSQFAHVAHKAFESELGSLDYRLDRLLEQKVGTVGSKTVASQLDAYKALRDKAEAYGELLGMRQDRVNTAIAALKEKATKVLVRGAGETPAPKQGGGTMPLPESEAAF